MHSDERRTTALVEAAKAGDVHARDELVHAFLPLVHNIVGRALDGHADTDDIVQETMVRVLGGLPGLRDPARFRSWLVAIAMNGIRRRWHERRQAPVPGLDRAADPPTRPATSPSSPSSASASPGSAATWPAPPAGSTRTTANSSPCGGWRPPAS